jgi:hypothetical protein
MGESNQSYLVKNECVDIHVNCMLSQWGRFINKKRAEKNKNRGERQKNSENQVTLDSIFGASKKHYLSNFVLYML